jgi:hypothetical protein
MVWGMGYYFRAANIGNPDSETPLLRVEALG